ncbi:hypothetical protein HDU76_008014 [Blyttiomyces sp. JEL0837]|nr:hypothetical protein HDU76_008014 [Blyttiomyces sp. JEL0837]
MTITTTTTSTMANNNNTTTSTSTSRQQQRTAFLKAANFLLKDDADRQELMNRFYNRSIHPTTTTTTTTSTTPESRLTPQTISTTANFLLRNDTDRQELVSRLSTHSLGTSSRLPSFTSDATDDVITMSTPSSYTRNTNHVVLSSMNLDHPMSFPTSTTTTAITASVVPSQQTNGTIQNVASFLLRNDADREELVTVIRKSAGRYQSFATISAKDEAGYVASSGNAIYGIDQNDIFNQLVMLETPALSTRTTTPLVRAKL